MCVSINAQSEGLSKHFKSLAKGSSSYLSKAAFERYTNDIGVISDLESYYKSENTVVQKEAIRLMGHIGATHSMSGNRQTAVYQLLSLVETASSNNIGEIIKSLQRFQPADYSVESRRLLINAVTYERSSMSDFIRLMGYLDMQEELKGIEVVSISAKTCALP